MDLDDAVLWQRVNRGHELAFDELFVRHGQTIYRYCFRRTADRSDAEDLMAATFFELWRRRDRLSIASDSALPLLYGIATNLLRRRRRSLKAFERAVQKCGATIAAEQDSESGVAERLAERDLAARAVGALKRLKPRDRDIVSLRLFGELSYAEIAEALNISPGTVASRLNRAIARLGDDPALSLTQADIDDIDPTRKKVLPSGIGVATAESSAASPDPAHEWSTK